MNVISGCEPVLIVAGENDSCALGADAASAMPGVLATATTAAVTSTQPSATQARQPRRPRAAPPTISHALADIRQAHLVSPFPRVFAQSLADSWPGLIAMHDAFYFGESVFSWGSISVSLRRQAVNMLKRTNGIPTVWASSLLSQAS